MTAHLGCIDTDQKTQHVHHCVGNGLLDHAQEKADPKAFETTLVRLSAGDSVRWSM